MTRAAAYQRLERVGDELDAARFAIAHTLRLVRGELKHLQEAQKGGTSISELTRCAENLDETYILRLFSEFEGVIRDFWVKTVRKTQPRMEILMNSVADRLKISPENRRAA